MLTRRAFTIGSLSVASIFNSFPALAAREAEDEIDPLKARILRVARDTKPGVIHVHPDAFALFWTMENGRAIQYPIGVARPELWEPGRYIIRAKREWPSWTPTPAMIERDPSYAEWEDGMPGGPGNPLGARALYLHHPSGGDTHLRIHGTNKPDTILTRVSNGCARLTNGYVTHLYDRVPLGTEVYLHPMRA